MTTLRNAHFATHGAATHGAAAPKTLPRERVVTNDPAREYAQRRGAVERISDELAACIMCAKRMATVSRGQIDLQIGRRNYKFFAPDSITLRGCTGETKVVVVFNRLENPPRYIHVMTRDGVYVETLPRKGLARHFDPSSAGNEFAAARRFQSHIARRLQDLHEPDSERAVEAARDNRDAIAKAVYQLPLKPDDAPPRRAGAHVNSRTLSRALDATEQFGREQRAAELRRREAISRVHVSDDDISAATTRAGEADDALPPDEIADLLRD